jgi:hypothetical protein
MIISKDLKSLESIFQVLRLKDLDMFKDKFEKAVLSLRKTNDLKTTDQIIKFYVEIDTIITRSFGNCGIFQTSLKLIFSDIINSNNMSQHLPTHAHKIMLSGCAKQIDVIKLELDVIASLYSFLFDKDIFETYYQRYFANRLLNSSFESKHLEQYMHANLRKVAGIGWSNKLERMYKDVESSQQLDKSFEDVNDTKINLSVIIGSSGKWPTKSNPSIPKLPGDFKNVMNKYDKFYINEFSGREIMWQVQYGTCEIDVYFSSSNKKQLTMSMTQAMVFSCFNQKNIISIGELVTYTGINIIDLTNPILSMYKVGIIRKNPPTKCLTSSDKIMINNKFKSKLKRLKIPTFNLSNNSNLIKKTNEAIVIKRRQQIDAAIVRIMKTRSSHSHKKLLAEVIKFITAKSFSPQPRQVKQRIEAMIIQEYIKRDDEIRSLYHYIA